MNIHKIDDESCRSYIFQYFFKFLSFRLYNEPMNKSIVDWILSSKFDLFIYLLFIKVKYFDQDLMDYMNEAVCNCLHVNSILLKFDYFKLLTNYEVYFANLRLFKPKHTIYVVGVLYSIIQHHGFVLGAFRDQHAHWKSPKDKELTDPLLDLASDSTQRKLFNSSSAANNAITIVESNPSSSEKTVKAHNLPPTTEPPKEPPSDDNTEAEADKRDALKFMFRVLSYSLRNITFFSLPRDFDYSNLSKQEEYFRYLLLLIDLSSKSENHELLLHPILTRDVIYFTLNSGSEQLFHYHHVLDCNPTFIRLRQYDAECRIHTVHRSGHYHRRDW